MKNPRATDRTEGIASVTTRTPESSSVRRCCAASGMALPPVAVAGARTAIATVATAAASAAPIAPAAAARTLPLGGRNLGKLLHRLALDLGVVGHPQADPPALAVHLDHLDLDLVALAEHLLHRGGPLARRDVGDVQQAVGALVQLDEGAERRGL